MRVDIHTHAFAAHRAAEILRNIQREGAVTHCLLTPHSDGTLDGLLRQEVADGFDRVALCPIATKPTQFGYMEHYLTALRSGALGMEARERIIPCASLHPDDPDIPAHARALVALGAKMVKLHPYFQNARLDSRKMLRLMAALTEVGLPILCHTGCDISARGLEYLATPKQILHAYRIIPGLRMICAHCAAWHCEETEKFLLGRRIYVDLAFQPATGVERIIRRFAEEHPQDYVLFGSDSPWARPGEHAKRIASWNIAPERLAAIMGGNACRLLAL